MEVAACVMNSNDNQVMRVAYLFPRGDLGGAEVATVRFIAGHDRSKVTPVALFLEDGEAAVSVRDLGVTADIAPLLPRLSRAHEVRQARAWLRDRLEHHQIDIQHAVMPWTHALAGSAARKAGTRSVWFQHNRPNPFDPIDWYASLSKTDLIVANSYFVARLQQRMNLRRFPVEVVHPPVDLPTRDQRSTSLRSELGADETNVLAVLAGRLQRGKGQDVAVRAMAIAAGRAPNLRLAVVGGVLFGLEREYRSEIEELAKQQGMADRIQFVGFRRDMTAVYASADIVLQCSRNPEAFGLVVAEGLAHGRAVIASDAGGLQEQIDHERTGLLVRPDDPAALADALVRVTNDTALRERLSAAARAESVTTPESAAARLETLYETVLARAS